MNNENPFLPTISISLIVIHLHYLFVFTVRKKHIKCWLNWNWNPILRFIYLPSPGAITIALVQSNRIQSTTHIRMEKKKKKAGDILSERSIECSIIRWGFHFQKPVRERFLIVPFCNIVEREPLTSFVCFAGPFRCRFLPFECQQYQTSLASLNERCSSIV